MGLVLHELGGALGRPIHLPLSHQMIVSQRYDSVKGRVLKVWG